MIFCVDTEGEKWFNFFKGYNFNFNLLISPKYSNSLCCVKIVSNFKHLRKSLLYLLKTINEVLMINLEIIGFNTTDKDGDDLLYICFYSTDSSLSKDEALDFVEILKKHISRKGKYYIFSQEITHPDPEQEIYEKLLVGEHFVTNIKALKMPLDDEWI